MNLEVAVSDQTETFRQTESGRIFWGWLDLGENTVELRVPVTYRYHLKLTDAWRLDTSGARVIVYAPAIRASLPPAIHTDKLEQSVHRGWCRLPPDKLCLEAWQNLTPVLTTSATDPARIALVRETARTSVSAFIQKWLAAEGRWGRDGFAMVEVIFDDEPQKVPSTQSTPRNLNQ